MLYAAWVHVHYHKYEEESSRSYTRQLHAAMKALLKLTAHSGSLEALQSHLEAGI